MTEQDPLEAQRAIETGESEAPTFWFEYEGRKLPFRLNEVRPAHARLLRAATGLTPSDVYRMAGQDDTNDIDSAGYMWWLTLLQNGEDVDLPAVEENIRFDHYPKLLKVDGVELEDDSPEA